MPTMNLNRRTILALAPVEKPTVFYDETLTGFGLKVTPSRAKSWIVEYRPGVGGRGVAKKRVVIGSLNVLSPEQARKKAGEMLARAKLGADPARDRSLERGDITVEELCDRYLNEGCSLKKASTIKTDRSRIECHVKPLMGRRRVRDIERGDVDKLLRDIASGKSRRDVKTGKQGRSIVTGGKGAATRTVRLLGGIFTWAVEVGLRDTNPVSGVSKFPDKAVERFLSSDELSRLGTALSEAETVGIPFKQSDKRTAPKNSRTKIDTHAAAAIRLLLLTGCRLSEILKLRWSEVDMERGFLFLPDSKTGKKPVVLSEAAQAILADLPRIGVYVIASRSAGQPDEKPRSDLKRPWESVLRHAGISELRRHDLRHNFASVGAGGGMGLPIIGKLLGHKNPATTARYAHLDADPVRRATNAIGELLSSAMVRKDG